MTDDSCFFKKKFFQPYRLQIFHKIMLAALGFAACNKQELPVKSGLRLYGGLHLVREINGYDIVFNVYSYVYIYSRHYIPNMNLEIGLSTNPELPEVDVEEMPDSILNLIERYNEKYPITPQTEYCLFKNKGEKYILWLKYKTLNETKSDGFEVRSFYKCLQESDLIKFETDVRQMCF